MANKQKLQGLIGAKTPVQRGEPYSISTPGTDIVPAPSAALQRGAGFSISTADTETPLPEAVLALRPEMRELARNYIGARRRSGIALLEASRWLAEARVAAEYGEWDDFLTATETSPDTAERLLRINTLAIQHPGYASAVADGRFNQSVAERLSRSSTPVEVIDEVLATEKSPTVAEVDKAIRAARDEMKGVKPKGETFPTIAEMLPEQAASIAALASLQEAAAIIHRLAEGHTPFPPGEATEQVIRDMEQALTRLRSLLRARSDEAGT